MLLLAGAKRKTSIQAQIYDLLGYKSLPSELSFNVCQAFQTQFLYKFCQSKILNQQEALMISLQAAMQCQISVFCKHSPEWKPMQNLQTLFTWLPRGIRCSRIQSSNYTRASPSNPLGFFKVLQKPTCPTKREILSKNIKCISERNRTKNEDLVQSATQKNYLCGAHNLCGPVFKPPQKQQPNFAKYKLT